MKLLINLDDEIYDKIINDGTPSIEEYEDICRALIQGVEMPDDFIKCS